MQAQSEVENKILFEMGLKVYHHDGPRLNVEQNKEIGALAASGPFAQAALTQTQVLTR